MSKYLRVENWLSKVRGWVGWVEKEGKRWQGMTRESSNQAEMLASKQAGIISINKHNKQLVEEMLTIFMSKNRNVNWGPQTRKLCKID